MNRDDGPRRRNAERTRARILDAAQRAFAEIGYSQAGIREIATRADVSSSLLDRYFGSKAGLFEACLMDALREPFPFGEDRSRFGRSLAHLLTAEELDFRLPAMLVLSIGDAEARTITTKVVRHHIVEPLAKWLGPPNARARALRLIMLCTGYVIYTHQIRAGGTVGSPRSRPDKWLATTLQSLVD